jgi:tetratricopeptide (TPR) repeat protein
MAREFNQALEHAKQHSLDLAQIALRKAVSINHNFIKGHLLMALIYQEQGRKGMARKCLSRVLTLDRTNITALRYLREMGETEEQIVRLAEQGDEEFDDLFDDYYGVETPEGQRPARKIEPKTAAGKRRSVSVRQRFKESNLARYSNVYMFAGIIIGMLILYFLIIPGIRRNAAEEKDALEASYLKELSAKNSELSGMQMTVSESEKSVEKVQQEKEALQNQIASLEAQMVALKNQLASGGAALIPDKTDTDNDKNKPGDDDRAEQTYDEDLPGDTDGEAGDSEVQRADAGTHGTAETAGMTAGELKTMIENE